MVLAADKVKTKIQYASIPVDERWRIGVAKDVMTMLDGNVRHQCGMTESELKDILEFACSS